MATRKSIVQKMDTLARKIVHKRDGCCQYCGSHSNLECAHVAVIRRYYIARWDLINLLLLCHSCHSKHDSNTAWGMEQLMEKFPARFKYLTELQILRKSSQERTRTWRDSDLKEIEIQLKEKLKEMS